LLLSKGYDVHGIVRRASISIPAVSIIFIKTLRTTFQAISAHGDLADDKFNESGGWNIHPTNLPIWPHKVTCDLI